jgi:hypothetical protein
MGERMGRIGRIRTDFFVKIYEFQAKESQKSVSICRIRPIRSPIVSPFAKAKSYVAAKYAATSSKFKITEPEIPRFCIVKQMPIQTICFLDNAYKFAYWLSQIC